MKAKPIPKTINEYIAGFPENVQAALSEIRSAIRKAAPEAEETIKYEMPTFMLRGRNLVYFAAFKKHIGFYPAPMGVAEFKTALARYGAGKGTLRFPLDEPIPVGLVVRIAKFRAKTILAKSASRRKGS